MRNQVPRVLLLVRRATVDEISEALRVAALVEMEIQPLRGLLERQDLAMRIILQDELLQHAQGPAVRHLLPNLDDGVPRVGCEGLLAILALLVDHLEFHDHGLLQHTGGSDLLLDGELHPDAHGVLLGPDEGRVHEPHVLTDALDALEAKAQKFPGLWLSLCPRRPVVAATVPTARKRHLPGDAVDDGHLRFQALGAAHGLVGDHRHATAAAQHRVDRGARGHDIVILPLHAPGAPPGPEGKREGTTE
mmetsp:Transcript_16845/g.43572  ORF Transcript_16845/g.43572 Transcript_16845/m.43572 type:complete len:248 (+) Transcript_16845:1099-1842(+)